MTKNDELKTLRRRTIRSAVMTVLSLALISAAVYMGSTFSWFTKPVFSVGGDGTTVSSGDVGLDVQSFGYDVYKYDLEEEKGIHVDSGSVEFNQYDRVFQDNNQHTPVILRAAVQGFDADTLTLHLDSTATSFFRTQNDPVDDYLSNIINVKVGIIPHLTDAALQTSDPDNYIYTQAVAHFDGHYADYTMDEDGNYERVSTGDDADYYDYAARYVYLSKLTQPAQDLKITTISDVTAIESGEAYLIRSGNNILNTNMSSQTLNYTAGTYRDTVAGGTDGTDVWNTYSSRTKWTFTSYGNNGGFRITNDTSYLRNNNGTLTTTTNQNNATTWYCTNGVIWTYTSSSTRTSYIPSRYRHDYTFYALTCDDGTWKVTTTTAQLTGQRSDTVAFPSADIQPTTPAVKLQTASTRTEHIEASTSFDYDKATDLVITVSGFDGREVDDNGCLFVYVQIDYDPVLVNEYMHKNMTSARLGAEWIPFVEDITFTLGNETPST